jgi:tRNA pseudouridine55 synthase
MNGIIIIDKPKGYTSHDVIAVLRKVLNIKKIGHVGTLDPNATGVLPILIGQATKVSKYLMEHDKRYIAKIALGEKRTTRRQ